MARGKHTFRLEPVLDQRRRLTDAAQLTLADRSRELTEAQAALEETRRLRELLIARLAEQGIRDDLDVAALVSAEAYINHLTDTEEQRREHVAVAVHREDDARSELLRRRVDLKVLEKLRERRQQEQADRLSHAEAQTLDEIATAKHAPRRAGLGG